MRMANIAQLLTEHIDIWTAADTEKKSGRGRASGSAASVYGVKKLRELIIDLAVRGKLVPQDLNGASAEVLVKNAKDYFYSTFQYKHRELERDKSILDPTDYQHQIPDKWRWTELQEICMFFNGKAHEMFVSPIGKYILVNSSFISNNGDKVKNVSECLFPLEKNDIAIVMSDVPLGKALVRCFIVDESEKYSLNQRIGCLKLPPFFNIRYIKAVIERNRYYLDYDDGQKQTNLKKIQVLSCPIPLPPLEEQNRIVAKVDELMALCDQLEQQHSNAKEAHEILVSQLLATLTQSQNATKFNANWQRIYAHFDVLFTTEASIDSLKQTLLQLAVMGKLVPQDANDEPASELLKRIQAEKAKLIAEGKLKKETPLAPIGEYEKPFEVPMNWEWARLADLLAIVTDGDHQAPPKADSGIPFLVIGNLNAGSISIENCRFVPEQYFEKLDWIKKPLIDDLLYTVTGSYGIPIKVESSQQFCVQRHVAILKSTKSTPVNYLVYLLKSKYAFEYATEIATGIAQKTIPLTGLRMMTVPIPSELEQHRIVAKVDALMSLCDQLKTSIQQANQQQQAIANTLVAQAVAA